MTSLQIYFPYNEQIILHSLLQGILAVECAELVLCLLVTPVIYMQYTVHIYWGRFG